MKNIEQLIEALKNNKLIFEAMLNAVSEEEAAYKKTESDWSILEIVNHLYDEEREDFRYRALSTVEDPAREWPRIDPQGWVKSRNYSEKNFRKSISLFLQERENSLQMLIEAKNSDWQRARRHPEIGDITAYNLLCNWAAHDLHHLRQINKRRYEYLQHSNPKEDVRYAGEW